MHMYKWQWSIVQSHLGGEASTSYFTPYTPMDPPKFQKKLLDPLILPIQTSNNDNEASYKVSSLYNQPSQRRSEHKLFHTLHPSLIHHNSKKNYWILLSWQYAHLLMIMKHCTKFQVSTASRLRGEVSTRFCDRQTDGQTDWQKVQKQYVSPRMGET